MGVAIIYMNLHNKNINIEGYHNLYVEHSGKGGMYMKDYLDVYLSMFPES